MKGPAEKNFEGIYANPRFMHAAGMIVGCIVQVQVKNGATFEGVLRTFSHKADFVLEMPRKIDSKKSNNATSNTVTSLANSEEVTEKMIFRFDDVVTLNAQNVDPDYATRDSFTDTAISKFNGQVVEKELEPWDGGSISADSLPDLGGGDEEANGWDANDMFRTNEEKYGVKSSFDSNLPGYTIPLNKQNTEEYRQQEARASKLASEIESGSHHKSRAALENGDEEDRYSAVIRPADNSNNNSNNTNNNNNNNNFRYVSHRNRKPVTRSVRNSAPPPHHANRNSHQHPSLFRVSSPASAVTNSQGNYKMVSPMSATSCVSALSTRPTPDSTPTSRQSQVQQNQLPLQPPAATQYPSSVPVTNTSSCVTPLVPHSNTPLTPTVPQGDENPKINGEAEKTEIKFTPKPPRSLNLQSVANKEMREVTNQQGNNKTSDRRKDADKKQLGQKAREDKTEDLKRFHSKFKLSEDPKDAHDTKDMPKSDVQTPSSTPSSMPSSKPHKDKSKEDERKIESIPENRGSPDNPKSSTLNPNAKEFVFNPNAKSFTPRAGMPMQNVVPPPVQPPPRLHTQSPIMAMPQHHIIPGMPQTVFNVAPHYVVSATPVSLPMAPPFTPAASVTQAPRFRKAHATIDGWGKQAMPIMHRQDLSQPVHVQAATGQPILAQPTLSAPQFAIQYAPSPGMLHPPGPPQQLAYAQMYSLMPRVLTPQPVGMVPTSAAYGENPQIPTHVYMHPGTPSLQHPMASNSGQHSAPSTPQSQTPNLHPAPSPVHQPPPSGTHGQPPTPTGHPSNAPTPQPVMYAHGHMTTQHPLHANHSSSNQGHPFAASYAGTPQPIVILPQQPHAPHPATFAAAASSLPNHHLHGQTPGSHVGTPTHVLPHAQMAMIPTSAAMVHTPTAAISTGHYIPHSQV